MSEINPSDSVSNGPDNDANSGVSSRTISSSSSGPPRSDFRPVVELKDDVRCKWCRRWRYNTPSPFPTGILTLPWRKSTGRECASCPYMMAASFHDYSKKEMEQKLNDAAFLNNTFLVALAAWEKRKMDGAIRPGRATKKVKVHHESNLGMEMQCGVFWPLPVYIREKKCEPNLEDVRAIKFGTSWLKGILRPEAEGLPIGCIRMTSGSVVRVVKETVLNDSRDNVREDETEAIFKAACKKTSVAVVTNSAGSAGLKATPTKKRKSDEEDVAEGLCDLDDFWSTTTPFKLSKQEKMDPSAAGSDGPQDTATVPPTCPRKQARGATRPDVEPKTSPSLVSSESGPPTTVCQKASLQSSAREHTTSPSRS